MKKVILGLCLFIYGQSPFLLRAQTKRNLNEKARYYTRIMMKTLALPDSLDGAIYAVNYRVSIQIDSLYAAPLENGPRKQAMRRVFQERDSLYRGILTKQQYLQYDDWQREQWEKKQAEKKMAE
jgi:hypothetical protein